MAEDDKTLLLDNKDEKPAVSRQAYLVVIKGGSVGGKKYQLTGSNVIGRSAKVDICLDQASISRKHAEIILDESCQKATVNDLSSMNGTYYKGRRIKSVEIFDGEQIEFGDITCKFVTDINAEGNLLEFASVDDMTKAYNKRYFNEIISAEFRKSEQSGAPLTLIMFDIDKFKNINDNYGHSVGDYILKTLCASIFPMLKEKMILARVGGEEFAILMPGSSLDDGIELAERIRSTIERYLFTYNKETIPVTVSCGVCEKSEETGELREFISKTDSLLYLAKNTGRNRVCS